MLIRATRVYEAGGEQMQSTMTSFERFNTLEHIRAVVTAYYRRVVRNPSRKFIKVNQMAVEISDCTRDPKELEFLKITRSVFGFLYNEKPNVTKNFVQQCAMFIRQAATVIVPKYPDSDIFRSLLEFHEGLKICIANNKSNHCPIIKLIMRDVDSVMDTAAAMIEARYIPQRPIGIPVSMAQNELTNVAEHRCVINIPDNSATNHTIENNEAATPVLESDEESQEQQIETRMQETEPKALERTPRSEPKIVQQVPDQTPKVEPKVAPQPAVIESPSSGRVRELVDRFGFTLMAQARVRVLDGAGAGIVGKFGIWFPKFVEIIDQETLFKYIVHFSTQITIESFN